MTSMLVRPDRWLPVLALAACTFAAAPRALAAPPGGGRVPEPAAGARALLERALPEGVPDRPDGRELFTSVLASDLFASGSVGPFDLHVLVEDELSSRKAAEALRDELLETLRPAAELVERLWPAGGGGLVSDVRLPLVVAESQGKDRGFASVIELLDHCERLGYSDWLPANEVDTVANRTAEVVRTWEVQVFNMGHDVIRDRRKRWVSHGVGYYALAFVANRSLRRGAWGLVPPWLANGLIDELDIAAYGEAWVGQESWVRQTPGWFRPGWSGFVPQGSTPPPPVTGPPADLAVTVSKTGDPWLDFGASEDRHWGDLVNDLKTEAPASFARAAATESFLPRDRAAARCLLHLLLETPPGGTPLTALLDDPVSTPRDGMPDSDPLPVIFSRALGGVPEVDRLEALDSRALLEELGRGDLVAQLEKAGAGEALALSDHREQSRWLARQPQFDSRTRGVVFNLFLEIEYAQQMAEWRALAPRLDGGMAAALGASRKFPERARDLEKVASAFAEGVTREPGADDEDDGGRRSKKRSRRR